MNQSGTDLLIYRVKDTGLEVFLLDSPTQSESVMPTVHNLTSATGDHISLEPITNTEGQVRNAIAIEADWHDIPSLRALIRTDYEVAKQKAKAHIKSMLPEIPHLDLERGTYVAIKDAFKQVLPEQYAFLKELKQIVREKNQTKYV